MRSSASSLFALSLLSGLAACKGGEKSETESVKTTTADGSLSSPSSDAAERRGVSMVRMINALPNANDASISADDRSMFSSVAFKTVTPYTELNDNITRFRLTGGGRDTSIASNNEILMDGSRYTLVALPEGDGGVRLRVLKDELTTDSTKSRLRVIHGVKDAGEIDVLIMGKDDPFFDNVNLASEAGFKDVDPLNTTLIVRADGSRKQLLKREMEFKPGHSYSVILTGTSGRRVEAIVIDDATVSRGPTESPRRNP